MQHSRNLCLAIAALALPTLLASAGCGDDPDPLAPGKGVVFSYPFPDQFDVPVGTRVTVGFTDPVDEAALSGDCTETSGAFCIVGPDGPLANVAVAADPDRRVIHFEHDGFDQGATYQVFARPELLGGGDSNLLADAPIFTFRTRQLDPIGGQPPSVLAINGEYPEVFLAGGAVGTPRFPAVDFMTVRVLFSEPVATESVIRGDTFRFVEVDAGTGGIIADVPGALYIQGIHLSFDPDQDLTPGKSYRLILTEGIRDLGGEALVAGVFEFVPASTEGDSGRTSQILNTTPARGEPGFDESAESLGRPNNRLDERSPLIGEKVIELYDATLLAELADANAFKPAGENDADFVPVIPVTLRKGAVFRTTGLDVTLGGQLPIGLSTGDLTLQMPTDATGYMIRNPFRSVRQIPNDNEAPIYMVLTFDVVLSADDPTGNALVTQNTLSVQVAGTVKVDEGTLTIEAAGATQLDLAGVDLPTVQVSLGLSISKDSTLGSDDVGPSLVATYPAGLDQAFPGRDRMLLTFSEGIDLAKLTDTSVTLATAAGTPVPVRVDSNGATLVVTPLTPLQNGQDYRISLGDGLVDIAGNPFVPRGDDATGGQNRLDFRTAPIGGTNNAPLVTAVFPGAPCALTGATAESPGHCTDGQGTEDRYAPFELAADRDIEVYFNQPMNPNFLVAGGSCGNGSVRVEAVDEAGACIEAVPGTLVVSERSARFVPNAPWTPGQLYRLTLVAGGNNTCNAGEICGINNRPLNSDALDSPGENEGGGPNIQLTFSGVAADPDKVYLPAITSPMVDSNGNGRVDGNEVTSDSNRGVQVITDTGFPVTSARFDRNDCAPGTPNNTGCFYLSGSLPVTMGQPESDCIIGQDENDNAIVVPSCIPVDITPQILYGTSLRLRATAIGFVPITTETGTLIMRVLEEGGQPNKAFIVEDGEGGLKLIMDLVSFLDAPDLSLFIIGKVIEDKLIRARLEGPVTFASDGRVTINVANTGDIELTISLGIGGSIDMRIPTGNLTLQLQGLPPKGAMR